MHSGAQLRCTGNADCGNRGVIWGGLGGRRPPKEKEKTKKERKKRKKKKKEKREKKEEKRKKGTINNVKLLHIKCCFFNFSIVRWHWKIKKKFRPPQEKVEMMPLCGKLSWCKHLLTREHLLTHEHGWLWKNLWFVRAPGGQQPLLYLTGKICLHPPAYVGYWSLQQLFFSHISLHVSSNYSQFFQDCSKHLEV